MPAQDESYDRTRAIATSAKVDAAKAVAFASTRHRDRIPCKNRDFLVVEDCA